MSERDELLYAVQTGMSNIDNWPDDTGYKLLGVNMSKPQNAVVDAVLAAGYRRPRTITTTAELDALRYGSVVLDADRATATKLDADYWEVAGYASHFRADAVTLPATVLHEPEATL